MENRDLLEELDLILEENNKNIYSYETIVKNQKNKFLGFMGFMLRYITTCIVIFSILMIGSNYKAYYNIAKSYIYKNEVKEKTKSIISSVEAASLKKKVKENIKEENNKGKKERKIDKGANLKKYKRELDTKDINLDIEITPYENRIIIPKIGKNIPLVDIKNREIKSENELENIFMDELEKGVIRYPGSAIPGQIGTTFVFGHSSNYPWIKGDYNDVFSTLDNVIYGDEIIVYYGQRKYKYVIREKKVISPGDVSVLKRNKNKNELSIMTCWPVGTTLNRLILTGELIED